MVVAGWCEHTGTWFLLWMDHINVCKHCSLAFDIMDVRHQEICSFCIYYSGTNYYGFFSVYHVTTSNSFIMLAWQIPVILNAFGGILVGLVTQYSGGIKKVLWLHAEMRIYLLKCFQSQHVHLIPILIITDTHIYRSALQIFCP